MVAIGITGSFASGKSFVLNYLNNLGFATFSADKIVQNMYKDLNIQDQILKLIPNLKLFDKVLIARLIYNDAHIRQRLQNFIHPFVVVELLKFKQKYTSNMLLFAEIPLLFESSFEQYFDITVTTFCSEESRLKRAMMRTNFDRQTYDKISTIQLSQELKVSKTDFAINTDVDLLMLESQILQLIEASRNYARNNT